MASRHVSNIQYMRCRIGKGHLALEGTLIVNDAPQKHSLKNMDGGGTRSTLLVVVTSSLPVPKRKFMSEAVNLHNISITDVSGPVCGERCKP